MIDTIKRVVRWRLLGVPLVPIFLLMIGTVSALGIILTTQNVLYTSGQGLTANQLNLGVLTPGTNSTCTVNSPCQQASVLNSGTVNVPIQLSFANQSTTWQNVFTFFVVLVKQNGFPAYPACYSFGSPTVNYNLCAAHGIAPNNNFVPPGNPTSYDYQYTYGVKNPLPSQQVQLQINWVTA